MKVAVVGHGKMGREVEAVLQERGHEAIIVPRGGSVTQLVRIQNWTGPTMFHCHIVEHEDIGMMGDWSIQH